MKSLERTVLGLALGASLWACGGDETPTPPSQKTIEVRNGTWHMVVNTTFTGADSCLARSPFNADTNDVICSVSLISGDAAFPFTCDLTQDGSDVTFDCTGKIDLGICWQMADIQGGGSITGSWIDSTGSFRCPHDTLSTTVPFARVLSGMIRPAETEPTSP